MNRFVVLLLMLSGLVPGVRPTASAEVVSTAPTTRHSPPTTVPTVPVDATAVNVQCPVMLDEAALPEYELLFRGVRVRFCCNSCRTKFDQTPEPFLDKLPHVPPQAVAAASRSSSPSAEAWSDRLSFFFYKRVLPFATEWQPVLAIVLGMLLVNWAAGRMLRRGEAAASGASGSTPAGRPRQPRALLGMLANPALTVFLVAGVILGRTLGPSAWQASAIVGGARPVDDPPEVKIRSHMTRQAALQGEAFITGLEKTYYRGNDDRADQLYQGGIYRTCDFKVRLQTKDGQPVRPGDAVAGKRLFVRVEIVRAPNTLESHFRDSEMVKAFLMSRETNVAMSRGNALIAYPFTTLEPGERWVAECDVGEVPATGAPEGGVRFVTGAVLLCPGGINDVAEAWKSAHYSVQYELRLEGDGNVVSPKSKLWMGATLFTSDLSDDRFYEWFSTRPLPTIPDGYRHESELN